VKIKGLPSRKSRLQALWSVALSKGTTPQVSASNVCDLGRLSYPGAPARQKGVLATMEREETSRQRCRG